MDKEFAYASYADLESQRVVMLSQGGWGYFHSALEEADYAIEMLRERSRRRHKEWLAERIVSALDNLEHIHRQLTLFIPNACPPQQCQLHLEDAAVALDVASRSTASVIRAVCGHFHAIQSGDRVPLQRRQMELNDTRRALVRWTVFIDTAERDIEARATDTFDSRREHVRSSDVRRISRARAGCWDIDAIQNAKTALDQLHTVLAGDQLWSPHMDPDAFRRTDELRPIRSRHEADSHESIPMSVDVDAVAAR